MRIVIASTLVASFAWSFVAYGQSPIQVKYCQDMTASYRKAIAGGKTPVSGASAAAANCPTNPDASIPVLEGALKEMNLELPAR